MIDFIPGIELSRRYYGEVIRPILQAEFPQVSYAAAHLGPGSDVLGFDTAMSTNHDWGPSVHIFLPEKEAEIHQELLKALTHVIPDTFYGYHTDPNRIFITTPRRFSGSALLTTLTVH